MTFLAVLPAAALGILWWGKAFQFSPDSTNYLSAAQSLLRTGDLSYFANWPSLSLTPTPTRFTEYPPGYPVLLATWLAALRSPLKAAAWAHSVDIAACFLGFAALARAARIKTLPILGISLIAAISIPFRDIFGYLWTEPMFIAMSCAALACLACPESRAGWLAAAFLAGASSLKTIGIFNLAIVASSFLLGGRRRPGLHLVLALACAGPVAAWAARNLFYCGQISLSHHAGQHMHGQAVLTMAEAIAMCWCAGNLWLLPASLGLPAFFLLQRMRAPGDLTDGTSQALVLAWAAFLSHLVLLAVAALLCQFDPPDERLLSPSFAFFLAILLLESFGAQARAVGRAACLAVLALAVSPGFASVRLNDLAQSVLHFGTAFGTPVEARTWLRIQTDPSLAGAAFFYSDYQFMHQVFSGRPQRILFDWKEAADPTALRKNLAREGHPFLLVSERNPGLPALRATVPAGIRERVLPGYVAFYFP